MAPGAGRSVDRLAQTRAGMEVGLATEAGHGLPRISTLETEYLHTVTAAEEQWVRSVIDDLRAGRLTWSAEEMAAFDQAAEHE